MDTNFADVWENEILPWVQRPSRYLGTEVNSVHKDPAQVEVRLALAYPDLYDLGLGNLGLHILYAILNRLPEVWAERVYAPGVDLEEHLRRGKMPLCSLESKTPLAEFDALGFTLQSELTYTNLLNMLDLAGIPLRAAERDAQYPLILAGGPGAFNPEPLADFVDAFALGDGEELVLEIVAALKEFKDKRARREEQWQRLAEIPGLYVPALYPTVTLKDGTIVPASQELAGPATNASYLAEVEKRLAPKIVKRVVADLDAAPFPTDYLVPFTPQTHDRVSLEVLRGCTQGCRFCQAGMTTRPVRERRLTTLATLLQQTLERTGYEDISLVSLSTCDYSRVKSLLRQSVALTAPERTSLSLSSLRLDSFSLELADEVSTVRKTGLTFAPEAATDRLRAVINKFLPDEELLEVTRQCYQRGWEVLKLYFMIGLPTEREEDVAAIADLAHRVLREGRKVNRRARLHLGVATFVPKPHTPFQWERQISQAETEAKQDLLRRSLRSRAIKFGRHDPRESYLEGLISRGDRRVGRLLYLAHQLGCKFDAWSEHLNWEAWQEALRRWEAEMGVHPDELLRARELDEPLPWDHIDILIPKAWLQADCRRAQEQVWQADCRRGQCQGCGVRDREPVLCATMRRRSREGKEEEATLTLAPPTRPAEPTPVQRIRFRWARRGLARLLSHRETMNLFIRALRRAKIPLSYSQGFHPTPKLAFGAALPVGMESEAEYADVLLKSRLEPREFQRRLNATLPEGFVVLTAAEVPLRAPALMGEISEVEYEMEVPKVCLDEGRASAAQQVAEYLAQEEILVERRTKKGARKVDLRPFIADLRVAGEDAERVVLRLCVRDRQGRTARPKEVVQTLLGLEEDQWPRVRVRKVRSFLSGEGR